jgi:hypothetical protein
MESGSQDRLSWSNGRPIFPIQYNIVWAGAPIQDFTGPFKILL